MPSKKNPDNPSRRATKRVHNPVPIPKTCHYCDHEVKWECNSIKYNGTSYGEWPFIYFCKGCGASIGMHPFTNIPLGTLANTELAKARKEAKNLFNPLWQHKSTAPMNRNEAYAILADKMEIPQAACHFGMFDLKQAKEAEKICSELCFTYSKRLPKSVMQLAEQSKMRLARNPQ